jgi:hypothetical protein
MNKEIKLALGSFAPGLGFCCLLVDLYPTASCDIGKPLGFFCFLQTCMGKGLFSATKAGPFCMQEELCYKSEIYMSP